MRLVCVTPPYADAIDILAARTQCNLTSADNDADLYGKIPVAIGEVERLSGHQLVTATYELSLDQFPDDDLASITLPYAPLIELTSCRYKDVDGNWQTLDPDTLIINTKSMPGNIQNAFDNYWPDTWEEANVVVIKYVCGHALPFTTDATSNILTAQGRILSNGDVVRLSNSGGALPAGLATNTDYYVVNQSSATFQLAATLGGTPIDITDAGTGTSFIVTEQRRFVPMLQAALLALEDLFFHRDDNEPAISRLLDGGINVFAL